MPERACNVRVCVRAYVFVMSTSIIVPITQAHQLQPDVSLMLALAWPQLTILYSSYMGSSYLGHGT